MIPFFEEHNFRSFQITLDGNMNNHNNTRFIKTSKGKKESFNTIVNNIHLITSSSKLYVALRINYTKESLPKSHEIIPYFSDEAKKKITVNIVHVFQESKKNRRGERLKLIKDEYQTLNTLKESGFNILPSNIVSRRYYACYADKKNQALINYDGRVFNCTNTDFENAKENGILTEKGEIIWDENACANRLSRATLDNKECLNCFYLPICDTGCYQNKNKKEFINRRCIYRSKHEYTIKSIFDFYDKQGYKIAKMKQIESMMSKGSVIIKAQYTDNI
jgi:uncharacterized protein